MKNIIVGMTAWSLLHGEGTIKSYDGENIVVSFSGTNVRFDDKGRFEKFPNQILFFSKPKVDALAIPEYKPRFKSGEQVFVSSNQNGHNAKSVIVEFENEFCVTTENGKDYMKSEWFFFKLGQEVVMS